MGAAEKQFKVVGAKTVSKKGFETNAHDEGIAKANAEAAVEITKLKTAMEERIKEIEAEQNKFEAESDRYLNELKLNNEKQVRMTRVIVDGAKYIAVVAGISAVFITSSNNNAEYEIAKLGAFKE